MWFFGHKLEYPNVWDICFLFKDNAVQHKKSPKSEFSIRLGNGVRILRWNPDTMVKSEKTNIFGISHGYFDLFYDGLTYIRITQTFVYPNLSMR